jgi:tight adherence protein C
VGAVIQAEQRGTQLTQVLRTQAGLARSRRTVEAEQAASRAGVAMILPLILVFLCVILLVLGPMALSLLASSAAGGGSW